MIRRVAVLAALLAFGCATQRAAVPSATSFPHLDECVNPLYESMGWTLIEGRVIDVKSARTFRLRTDKGEMLDVSLANVGEPFDPGAAARLRAMIVGTRVSVMANGSTDLRNGITAEVHDRKGTDLSHYFLRAGAASFVKEPSYTLSGYSECVNRIAEREAKAAGVGIWKWVVQH